MAETAILIALHEPDLETDLEVVEPCQFEYNFSAMSDHNVQPETTLEDYDCGGEERLHDTNWWDNNTILQSTAGNGAHGRLKPVRPLLDQLICRSDTSGCSYSTCKTS